MLLTIGIGWGIAFAEPTPVGEIIMIGVTTVGIGVGISEMSKGGKQNIDNEYVREVQSSGTNDPCGYLRNLYRNTSDKKKRRKIKQAMKRYNCDGKGRFN